ncbi:MAG TPA: transglutaminase domain-containing protein [Agriterribacter sp.]|nr:transglutaminase domain-containing protein [Agriterribacter sp.]
MKKQLIIVIPFSLLLLLHCSGKKSFHVGKVVNPEFIADTVFVGYEDLSSPKFNALKNRYRLDTIFHGETDELKRILLLRNWIKTHIKIDNTGPYPGDGSPESILDKALKGHGFHCGHYMVVQNAVMNAYGYVTRCLGAGEGTPDFLEGHHGINEIWLNTYHKWFLSDAKYNYHFEKNHIPLSALEVRDAYLKNKAEEITLVKGPDRVPAASYPELNNRSKALFARIYTWISWDKYNNRYSNWPNDSSDVIMYQDDYFQHHTWIRDGNPHWAYNTRYLHLVADRKAIEWTPNTIVSKVTIEGTTAKIELSSMTPNFKTYQVKELPDGEWKNISDNLEMELKRDMNEVLFRAVNMANVTGPEHKVIIAK